MITLSNISEEQDNLQPSYCHITSSVSAVKSGNAVKNADAIIKMFGLKTVSFYAGGTNDNAGDTQKEIKSTFADTMMAVNDADEDTINLVHDILFENGVERRPIAFGDPYHIANLCVTWASIYAFGDREKADHSQVHHCQVLQSIHTLCSRDCPMSQAKMDEIMGGQERR